MSAKIGILADKSKKRRKIAQTPLKFPTSNPSGDEGAVIADEKAKREGDGSQRAEEHIGGENQGEEILEALDATRSGIQRKMKEENLERLAEEAGMRDSHGPQEIEGNRGRSADDAALDKALAS